MKGILKYQLGGKTEKINKIQSKLGLPQTGEWNPETEKLYRQKMQETGLSNIDLANQIVNKSESDQVPVIESFGKYKQCTAEGCAGFVTTKGAELLKINRNKYSKETGSEGSDAWTRKPYLIDKGGIELDVNDYSKINVGDVIGLDRGSYGSSIDSNWNKSRDKKKYPRSTENVHVGIVVGKTKDGVPVVEHYSAAKKMSYREPINNMKELGNYTTKWAVRPNINQKQQTVSEKKPSIDDRRLEVKTENPIRKQYVQSINDNLPKFAEISGLSQDELLGLGKIATGILQRESESGETSTPLGLKEAFANAAYTLGIKDTPASQGLTQIKPTVFQNNDGTFTFAGKYKPYFKIENLNNSSDAANATMLNLIQNYKSIKTKYPNMTNEQLWSAVARSHKGLDKQGINNVLNYEDEYSGKALMDASDVTYKGDNLPTIERIRTLREAMKNNIPAENLLNEVVVTPSKEQQNQRYGLTLAKAFEQGGLLKYKKGGKKNWLKDAVNPEHKGYCTPMTKSTCTPRRKAFAMTMKKHHGFHKKEEGGLLAFKKGGYLKDKNTYITKDGKETKRGLWANVYLKNKGK